MDDRVEVHDLPWRTAPEIQECLAATEVLRIESLQIGAHVRPNSGDAETAVELDRGKPPRLQGGRVVLQERLVSLPQLDARVEAGRADAARDRADRGLIERIQ